jgi:membrane-associated phospholipid phosphatase
MEVANAVSLTILTSFAAPLLLYMGTTELFYLKLFAGLFLANGMVETVKPMFGSLGLFGRPAGATACDSLCIGGSVGGRPGFPSGHMTNVSMLVSALWFHTGSSTVLWVGLPWITAMAWARWKKQCHNWEQILAGVCTGTVLGGLLMLV